MRLSKQGTQTQIMDQSQRIEEMNWTLNQAHLPRHMRMALPSGSMQFPVIESSQTGRVTSPHVRVATTPFHSARTSIPAVPRYFQEQRREVVQPGPETSARRGGAYKRLSDAMYILG